MSGLSLKKTKCGTNEDTFDVLFDHDIGGVRPPHHYRHHLPVEQVSAIYLLGKYESLH